ncbi:MAG: alpha-L-glutamate ligase-like protein [Pseudomonadota bacterium]
MWSRLQKLRQNGVLSINNRNANYILRYNDRKKYPLVDDKLKTKQLAIEHGVSVPGLLADLHSESEAKDIAKVLDPFQDFVVKPAQGAGGDGILVIQASHNGRYIKTSGQAVTATEMEHHCSNVLAGLFSLGGHRDVILIEERIRPSHVFDQIAYQGVPDVRVIVFCGFPVMAMLRLPTRQSQGKANLHQGAIGAGLDIATGNTLQGVWFNEITLSHPDTGNQLSGLPLPFWDQILDLSARCYEMTDLGYLGVDIIIDDERGPLMLELNARPGLNIQIANQAGLLKRLKHIEDNFIHAKGKKIPVVEDRIEYAREQFAAELTESGAA